MNKVILSLMCMLTLALLSCGGDSTTSVSSAPVAVPSIPVAKTSMKILDANKQPISGAVVTVIGSNAAAKFVGSKMVGAASASARSTSDSSGVSQLSSLPVGQYIVNIVIDGKVYNVKVEVKNNDDGEKTVILPTLLGAGGQYEQLQNGILASISGKITDISTGTGVAGASVSLSTKNLGAVVSKVTKADGSYLLLINVKKDKASELLNNASLSVSAVGYQDSQQALEVHDSSHVDGHDIALTVATAPVVAIWSEGFETGLGAWTKTGMWHAHSTSLGLFNEALSTGLVKLAHDDLSNGAIPNPATGNSAVWFGDDRKPSANGHETGNFMDVSATSVNTQGALNGGDTVTGSVTGDLISPVIDLTAETGDLSLSFQTWWEIESVNPNASGFDLMQVSYTIDAGATWVPLARLNPLADPDTGTFDRRPIPFTNGGYNDEPEWERQESIPLIDPVSGASLAGQTIQLKLTFDTVDPLFNGFRGWMLDDLVIERKLGTYMVLDNTNFDPFANGGAGGFATQSFDFIGLQFDQVTFLPMITPLGFNPTSGAMMPLNIGTAQPVSTTFDYNSAAGGSAELLISYDNGLPIVITGSNAILAATTASTMGSIVLTGSITPPAGNVSAELWVRMLDGAGVETFLMPVNFYVLQ